MRRLGGPNCDSNHFPVRVKIKQRIKKVESGAHKKPRRWATDILKNTETVEEYKRKVGKKLKKLKIMMM